MVTLVLVKAISGMWTELSNKYLAKISFKDLAARVRPCHTILTSAGKWMTTVETF